jgi:hypothetical protein
MKIRLLGLQLRKAAFESGLVAIFTDKQVEPWVCHFQFDSNTSYPVTLDVPTAADYTCLSFYAYVYFTPESGAEVLNFCGSARVVGAGTKAVFTLADGAQKNALGTLTFDRPGEAARYGAGPGEGGAGAVAYPELESTKTLMEQLIGRSTAWYKQTEPLTPALRQVHVPKYPCQFKLPGFAFAAQAPVDFEPEGLFERALYAAARRRGWPREGLAARLRSSQADANILMAESLAAIVNCCSYNEDCVVDEINGKPIFTEAFDASMRAILSGDCEDMAREVANLAWSLRFGTYRSELVRLAQRALSFYVVVELFGLEIIDPNMLDKSLEKYEAAPGSPLLAHAFVVFLPAAYVKTALRGKARLAHEPPGPAETLVQDGVCLTDPQPLAPTHPLLLTRTGLGFHKQTGRPIRVTTVMPTGTEVYKYMSSCMICDGSVVSTEHGTPVRELGFFTGTRYGATFEDVVRQSEHVTLVPTCILTPEEDKAIVTCTAYFHPIIPFGNLTEPNMEFFKRIIGGTRVERVSTDSFKGTFFVQGHDAADIVYLRKLKARLPANNLIEYCVDAFGKTQPSGQECFMVQVYIM